MLVPQNCAYDGRALTYRQWFVQWFVQIPNYSFLEVRLNQERSREKKTVDLRCQPLYQFVITSVGGGYQPTLNRSTLCRAFDLDRMANWSYALVFICIYTFMIEREQYHLRIKTVEIITQRRSRASNNLR